MCQWNLLSLGDPNNQSIFKPAYQSVVVVVFIAGMSIRDTQGTCHTFNKKSWLVLSEYKQPCLLSNTLYHFFLILCRQ